MSAPKYGSRVRSCVPAHPTPRDVPARLEALFLAAFFPRPARKALSTPETPRAVLAMRQGHPVACARPLTLPAPSWSRALKIDYPG